MRGSCEEGTIVLVAVACHVVVAVHGAALDVDFDVGPLGESLGHRARVCGIDNVVERVLGAVDDVQTLLEAGAGLRIGDEVVAHAAGDVEGGVVRHVLIHEDVERFEVFGIDACGVAHERASAAAHLVVPVVGVAEGFVALDAEVLFVGCPVVVLQLDRYVGHEDRHAALGHCRFQFIVAHAAILGLQYRAGSILEPRAAQLVDDGGGIALHGEVVFQLADDVAVRLPARLLIVVEHLGIDTDGGIRGEEVGWGGGRRQGLHERTPDGRAVEDALVELRHTAADDDRIQRAAIGKGIATQARHAVGDIDFLQARV